MTGKDALRPGPLPKGEGATSLLLIGKWRRRLTIFGSALAVVLVCVLIRAIGGRPQAGAQTAGSHSAVKGTSLPVGAAANGSAASRTASPAPGNPAPIQSGAATSSQQDIVATVNKELIHRNELAQECLAQYGKEVLETVMNKYLILTYCERQGIKISKHDVEEEIGRLAQKFSIPVDQWLQMLKQERGIKPEQYADDVVLPTLALRRLAAERIQPTQKELDDAYEAEFGTAVKARLIVLDNADKAREVHAKAQAKPDDFEALARKYSIDGNSAALGGLIQPIRRHLGDPNIENLAFSMQQGEVSPVIEVHSQFVIIKCEGQTDSSGYTKEQVKGKLDEFVRERKLRSVANEIFKKLQDESQVVNVYNDPAKRLQMPGVAATINGKGITIRELSEACIDRHGEEILQIMVNHKLLEQELKKRNLTVAQTDLDAEIARAALSAGRLKRDGKPDVDAWIKMVTEEQSISMDKYLHDAVWPSAALKLIAGDVQVTEEDIDRGYKANYGSKAQVRAIVLDNQRRAQEVWQKVRQNSSLEFFGKLAEQYSVEASSRANQGRVPPIRQFGGQPELEKEAFQLKPGEVSGIIQVVDKFVILYLEAYTKPIQVSRDEARGFIYEDVHEKKLRVAMSREFDRMKDEARIDNFLAGTSQSPEKRQAAGSRSGSAPISASQSPGGPTLTDNAAVPASYESTGLLPRNPPTPTSSSSRSDLGKVYGSAAGGQQSSSLRSAVVK